MRKAFILLMLGFVVFACQTQPGASPTLAQYESKDALVAAAKEVIKEISVEDFKTMYDGEDYFVLIDVRTMNEYDAGYIPGAANISRGKVEFDIAKEKVWDEMGLYIPEKTDPIVVNCKTGERSALAVKSLLEMGYENVMSLEGGFKAWNEAYPELIEQIIVDETGYDDYASEAEAAGGC